MSYPQPPGPLSQRLGEGERTSGPCQSPLSQSLREGLGVRAGLCLAAQIMVRTQPSVGRQERTLGPAYFVGSKTGVRAPEARQALLARGGVARSNSSNPGHGLIGAL